MDIQRIAHESIHATLRTRLIVTNVRGNLTPDREPKHAWTATYVYYLLPLQPHPQTQSTRHRCHIAMQSGVLAENWIEPPANHG